jgi:Bacterial trigger factor protein (TF)
MKYTIKEEKNSTKEIEVTIAHEDFIKYWDVAFKLIQKEVTVDGFRKGLAPQEAIIGKYGESAILQEMANQAISTTYVEVITKEKLHVISEPHIHIVKLTKGEEFVYHAHVTLFPMIDISNYKSVAEKAKSDNEFKNLEVTDEEVEAVMVGLSDEIKNSTENIEQKIKDNMIEEKKNWMLNQRRSKFLELMLLNINEKDTDAWPKQFEDKDKAQIIALQISKSEKLNASEEEIDAEVIKLTNVIPKQDPISGKINEARLREYATQIIINEKMFKSLDL